MHYEKEGAFITRMSQQFSLKVYIVVCFVHLPLSDLYILGPSFQ